MCQHHITVGNQSLKGVKHICCFYDSSTQLESVFLPYLQEGLEKGEQVVCIFPQGRHADLKDKLAERTQDAREAEARKQFQIFTEDETYLTGGSFAKERMAGMLKGLLENARQIGRPRVRTLGEMSWALRNLP